MCVCVFHPLLWLLLLLLTHCVLAVVGVLECSGMHGVKVTPNYARCSLQTGDALTRLLARSSVAAPGLADTKLRCM